MGHRAHRSHPARTSGQLSKIAQQRKSAKENQEKPETESERLFELELEAYDLGIECIDLADGLEKPAMDVGLSRAMEDAIRYYERLEKLEQDSLAKRVIILEQIRLYDEVLFLKGATGLRPRRR